ncbi:hypothetical protein DPMN_043359 [Dreissena polymorpha]|uniref:Uncharacterized protein n=1 Tax=Dreissena polymorpha TaxID=45954 RepID=A0A9D4D0A9_DREPO|nr:hypothetical protein DPMN_043359 [Dreissena polymorpha]
MHSFWTVSSLSMHTGSQSWGQNGHSLTIGVSAYTTGDALQGQGFSHWRGSPLKMETVLIIVIMCFIVQ